MTARLGKSRVWSVNEFTKDVRAQFGLVGCITSLCLLALAVQQLSLIEQGHFSTHALDSFASCYHIALNVSTLVS